MSTQSDLPPSPGPMFRPATGFLVTIGILLILVGLGFGFNGIGRVFSGVFSLITLSSGVEDQDFEINAAKAAVTFQVSMGLVTMVLSGLIIWLGINSIRARRWAIAFCQALGWLLLAYGCLQLVFYLCFYPVVQELFRDAISIYVAGREEWIFWLVLAVVLLVNVLIYIGPGAVLVLIYRRKNVQMTAQFADKKVSWTDALDVRVLILALHFFLGGLFLVPAFCGVPELLTMAKIIPNQWVMHLSLGVYGLLLLTIAVAICRNVKWAWWAALILMAGVAFSGWYLYNQIDVRASIEHFISEGWIDYIDEDTEIFERYMKMAVRGLYNFWLVTAFASLIYIGWIGSAFGIWKSADEAD